MRRNGSLIAAFCFLVAIAAARAAELRPEHFEAHDQIGRDYRVDPDRVYVTGLSAGGTRVKLTVYPDAEHDAWTRTYEDPAVWEWLFAQRRGSSGTGGSRP